MMRRIFLYAVLVCGGSVMAYPFAWMLTTSLKSLRAANTPSLGLLPEEWLWHNYVDAFQAAPFGMYFFNTFLVAILTTLAVTFTALLAGYAFARLEFRFKGPLFMLVLATMMVPFEVMLIPNFVLITRLGWYDSYAALIVPWCANAFSIFLMRQAFLTIPDDYLDAATIDGCGHLRFLFRVGAPMVRPSLVTVALFAFLSSYNALLWPLVVTADDSMRVVQVGLTIFSVGEGVRTQLLMCASTIVILPTVAIYFVAQRAFLESSLGSGIKT